MDPNPKSFSILSYVMSRLNFSKSLSRSTTQDYGIEQPQIQHHRRPPQLSIELIDHLPHLSDPTILASMKSSVAELAQTRSVLQTLDCPDHETLDLAKSRLVEIDAVLSKNLEEIIFANRPHDVDVKSWREIQVEREKKCRAKAEKEKAGYKAVVQLDEMHEAYERLLREAEEKLVRIYEGHDYGKVEEDDKEKKAEVNEEVVGILNEVAWKCVETCSFRNESCGSCRRHLGG